MKNCKTIPLLIESLPAGTERDAIIAFGKTGFRTWSYSKLAQEIKELSSGLSRSADAPPAYSIITGANSPDWLIACLSSAKAGFIIVPLDPQIESEIAGKIIADLKPEFIFSDLSKANDLNKFVDKSSTRMIILDDKNDEKHWTKLLAPEQTDCGQPNKSELAAIFFTSGTTAAPKGVPLSHTNLSYQLKILTDSGLVGTSDRILQPLPFHHIYPFTVGLLYLLSAGSTIIMPESFSGPQLIRALQEGEATGIIGVPRLYAAFYDAIIADLKAKCGILPTRLFELSVEITQRLREQLGINIGKSLFLPVTTKLGKKLRLLACGGAPLEARLARRLEGLGWQLSIGYGLTETSPLLTLRTGVRGSAEGVGQALSGTELRIDRGFLQNAKNSPDLESKQFLSESNIPDKKTAEARITDKENLKASITGEIQARGPGVFRGYHNLPDETGKAFTSDGWFRTGDLGYLHREELHVLGRISSLIVTPSGKKIDPEELEDHYSRDPIIKEIGIVQSDGKLKAVVVPNMEEIHRRGGWDIERQIHDTIEESSAALPSYKHLSGYVISREPIARTAMGKTKRHKLEESFRKLKTRAGKQKPASEKLSVDDEILLGHPEVLQVWKYLQDRYRSEFVTLDSNPQLDLGIDSLEWLELAIDLQRSCRIELDESAIGRINSVRELLVEISRKSERHTAAVLADALTEPDEHISEAQKKWLGSPGILLSIVQHQFYCIFRLLSGLLFRLRVIGADNIKAGYQYVITPNHKSYLDPFVLAASLPFERLQKSYWAGWTGIAFANSISRRLSRIAQAIPIDADQAIISSLALGAAVLKRKKSLIWFPEGRRSLKNGMLPFKRGLGVLLMNYEIPVVPVLLKGTSKALPPGSWILRPAQVTVIFGKPVTPAELNREGNGSSPSERIMDALARRMQALEQKEPVFSQMPASRYP